MYGSGDGNIHSPFIFYKPNASVCVVPHAVEDYNVSLLPLEGIYSVYVVFQIRQEINQKLHLSLIRRDNADVQRS